MLTELERLAKRCSGETLVSINAHTTHYHTIREYLESMDFCGGGRPLPTGYEEWTTLVEIQFFPVTPLGSYSVMSYSVMSNNLADAVAQCHEILDGEKNAD